MCCTPCLHLSLHGCVCVCVTTCVLVPTCLQGCSRAAELRKASAFHACIGHAAFRAHALCRQCLRPSCVCVCVCVRALLCLQYAPTLWCSRRAASMHHAKHTASRAHALQSASILQVCVCPCACRYAPTLWCGRRAALHACRRFPTGHRRHWTHQDQGDAELDARNAIASCVHIKDIEGIGHNQIEVVTECVRCLL